MSSIGMQNSFFGAVPHGERRLLLDLGSAASAGSEKSTTTIMLARIPAPPTIVLFFNATRQSEDGRQCVHDQEVVELAGPRFIASAEEAGDKARNRAPSHNPKVTPHPKKRKGSYGTSEQGNSCHGAGFRGLKHVGGWVGSDRRADSCSAPEPQVGFPGVADEFCSDAAGGFRNCKVTSACRATWRGSA